MWKSVGKSRKLNFSKAHVMREVNSVRTIGAVINNEKYFYKILKEEGSLVWIEKSIDALLTVLRKL